MPYSSITAAKAAGFPTSADGISLLLPQVNKLAEIYDAIRDAGTIKDAFAAAWATWKKIYKKQGNRWVMIATAAVQCKTEVFTAATSKNRAKGVPDHAAMIQGRLIRLGTRNLNGWGVTAMAASQIRSGLPGVPIRVCNSRDPHTCDYGTDHASNVGYVTDSRVDGDWVVAKAAITDKAAAEKIKEGTWMPFGKGEWSVTGYPSDPAKDFETSGLTNGFNPASIALIIGNGTPAFEGSGFDVLTAALETNYYDNDHRGDKNMTDEPKTGGGGNEDTPVTYTQKDLDKKIKEALKTQKTEFETKREEDKALELAKQKLEAAEALAKQKLEYDATIEKLSVDDKATYEARLAEMTPTADVEKIVAAAVAKGQEEMLDRLKREKLATEYEKLLTASIVGAPFMTDGVLDPEKVEAKMASVRSMSPAAISGMLNEAKLLVAAAATTTDSKFNTMEIPKTPPGVDSDMIPQKDLDALGIPMIEFRGVD